MKWLARGLLLGLVSAGVGCSQTEYSTEPLDYPDAKRGDVVDYYHGVKVADPYRWLEELDSEETRAWIEAENELTFSWLDEIRERDDIYDRLEGLWNYAKVDTPFKRGGRYFFRRNDGLQNQYVLYTTRALEDEPTVLLDPNTLSEDGTVALASYSVSDNGRYLAYALADAGSDWLTWYVRNIATGEDMTDQIKWSKFSGASWTKDGKGFYYSRYDAPDEGEKYSGVNKFQKLYFHEVGTPQSEDRLVYERPEKPEWGFSGDVTDDGRYLIISVWRGTERKNLLYYKDLRSQQSPVVQLIDSFEAQYSFVDNDGPVFWIRTDLDAERGRVIAIDTNNPGRSRWQEIIPQQKETLRGINVVGERFVAMYLKDAYSQVRMYDLDGSNPREFELPGIGSAGGFGGQRGDMETFYSYTSFSTPAEIHRLDLKTGESEPFFEPDVDFDADNYVTTSVFYTSKDGTRVPMFITHKKGVKLDGKNPTYLYGYGGFNIAITPRFSVTNLVWMEMGGVYAVANIRGGGEYGREWHHAGMKLNRQNVFDDFIAAAEWLIDQGYTNSSKLAIAGGSNGGLLVAACMTQRPDLYAAVLPAVGVLDMMRFTKSTIGWAWKSDYGSPEIEEEFRALYAYSPYHNLEEGTEYPAVLITTGDHDDRVVPWHSFKFAAALQEAHAGDAPTLIRIETRAGHGAGKPTSKRIQEAADKLAFLVRVLGMRV